ncbi:MAG: recombination mediator RecR [Saprospiraceae bacterium]
MRFSSKLLEEAMLAFNSLPGVGKKSALRMALHLMKRDHEYAKQLANAIVNAKEGIRTCIQCFNYSDEPICSICNDSRRDLQTICVVEGTRDIMAIEETSQYRGIYHVLGGVISPIDGVGPNHLHIEPLLHRVQVQKTQEIILAINPTIEGETTIYYLTKQLQQYNIPVSVIARGVSFGSELEYADEMTLGRSILARTPYLLKTGN